jgi:lipoprotein NlpI
LDHSEQTWNSQEESMIEKIEDPWQLVKSGQHQKAVDIYSRLYDEDGQPSHLYNRGSIYLDIGDYASALEDFKLVSVIQEPRLLADAYYISQGICYWFLDQPSQAVEAWRQGLTTPYTDAAGGVVIPALLLYAGERLDDSAFRTEALRLLHKHARRKLQEWPGAIVPFLLGKIGIAELEKRVQMAINENLLERWQCQADFYIAVRALREGDWATFQSKMTRCSESPYGYLEHEHYLARWEVERGFPDPPFA